MSWGDGVEGEGEGQRGGKEREREERERESNCILQEKKLNLGSCVCRRRRERREGRERWG